MSGEFHGQRSLAGYSPQGHKELDTTERLTVSLFRVVIGLDNAECLAHCKYNPHFTYGETEAELSNLTESPIGRAKTPILTV